MKVLRQIMESFRFAWKALRSNLLRTILSLLGVTVGIFAIIAVLTLVDSLEKNIKDSLNFIGTGVIYIEKMPWLPEEGGDYKWWEYFRRPNPSYAEYRFLKQNLKHGSQIAILSGRGNCLIKRDNNSIGQVELRGGSEGYDQLFEVPVEKGRYFTTDEVGGGRNVAVLGFEVARALFPNNEDAIGKTIKIKNLMFVVVGVIKQEGQSFMGNTTNDYRVIIPYSSFRKLYQTGTGRWNEIGSTIGVKGFDHDIGLVELENEIRGFLRTKRGVRPLEKDSFALNRP